MMKIFAMLLLLVSHSVVAGDDLIFYSGFELLPAACEQTIVFEDDFNRADQSDWGVDWQESGNSIELAEVLNNEGRLVPLASNTPYSLARIIHSVEDVVDLDMSFSLVFENASNQGIGFYARGNGGYLVHTDPMGEGYAVFIERFASNESRIGLWYEDDGIEIPFIRQPLMPSGQPYDFIDGIKYDVRFQVFQEDASNTRLRAKIWQNGTVEPTEWGVSLSDDFAPLQNVAGAIAVDSFNTQSAGTITDGIRVDDIVVKNLCNPLLKLAPVEEIVQNVQFAEGPVWKDDALLFSDIDANTIYQWQENSGTTIFNNDSGNANGLTLDANNDVVAAEHGNRRISLTDSNGTSTLVGDFGGLLFNSPNDVAVSQTGNLYFTDPDYGLNGRPREIAFNGVYKFNAIDGVTDQYQGDANDNKPNGIILANDQSRLFWSDTQTGIVHQMDIEANGDLSHLSDFATGLTIPDGMCVDAADNLYVATWNSTVEVYASNGDHWGSLDLPVSSITNCTFGGPNHNDLFITTRNNVYRSQATD
jgi:gluconolactonase